MQIYIIAVLIVSFLITVFALTNSAPLEIRLFFWKVQSSVPVLIFISAAAGALVMFLVSVPAKLRQWREVKKTKERLDALEEDKRLLTNRISDLTSGKPKDY